VIALIATTASGHRLAAQLADNLREARLLPGRPSDVLPEAFSHFDQIVLFLATGAAVRLISPLLSDKRTDPGVVCVDDAGRHAVSLVGGHTASANQLARTVADILGAEPVITTATDSHNLPALEQLGTDIGFTVDSESDVAAVTKALLDGERLEFQSDRTWPIEALPSNVVPASSAQHGPCLVVSDRVCAPPQPYILYRPPSLIVGVGASSGASSTEIMALIESALAEAGLCRQSVVRVTTLDCKLAEPGLVQAAESLGLELSGFTAHLLDAVAVPNPSATVREAVGTKSVAEAAALCGAASPAPGELVVTKRKSQMATVAIARRHPRGKLWLVSLGPGTDELLPPLARTALRAAGTVVGLKRYVDSITHLLRPNTKIEAYAIGEEVERASNAIERAGRGESVALVSSGDIGIYGMGPPTLDSEALSQIDVVVVPGISAANAASAAVGCPLGHDHCAISLSDRLTDWATIERRIEAAAEADFVISFYNPRSQQRRWQLPKALSILSQYRPLHTPVAVVTDVYRPSQKVKVTHLADLQAEDVSMTSTVIVGNSQTRLSGGRMVTPRGYRQSDRKAQVA
jgi:cobalt-precorrin 5A hydrolase / precorrin-3B C17-methyltransferase